MMGLFQRWFEKKKDERQGTERKRTEEERWIGLEETNPSEENGFQEVQAEDSFPEIQKTVPKDKSSYTEPFKYLGLIGLATFGGFIIFMSDTPSVDTSDAAKKAIETGMSASLSAGTVLMGEDGHMEPKDHTIEHTSPEEETTVEVWDYAAEDGDYVQILINGEPFTDPFMIKHKPQSFRVPSVGLVQIKGIRDGGGGITYAIHYGLNGHTYFNLAPENQFNTYTLVRSK